jgi:GTP cyclohydrolase I
MAKLLLSHEELVRRAKLTSERILAEVKSSGPIYCFPVPRGGIPAAYLIGQHCDLSMVNDPEMADIIIDDIIDSGKTMLRFNREYAYIPFFALVNKIEECISDWIIFPWEHSEEASVEDNIIRLLQFIGENPLREGLVETPSRVIKAWKHWFMGYNIDPSAIFKCFADGGEDYDQMILVKDIPFYSHCEHHLAPFFGTATIAYIPREKIVGLSKLSRLLDIYARRLQVQERLTAQITSALEKYLNPQGSACLIKARHLCMESRGIQKQGHITITSSLKGVFLTKPEAREEFMALAK